MGLAIAAMGAAALLTFKKMVKQYVEVGDMIHKMALRTGFAAETLSELAYAADISGADINMLEKGVKKMSKTIVDASYGLETYLRVFRSLDLEIEDLLKMKPEDQFLTLGAAIAEMESDTLRTAAAVDIFGRAGTMLLPFFKEGAEGIEKLRKEAHTLGIIFDEEAAAKAAKLKDAQTALSGSVKGLSIAILNDLIPVITDVTQGFTDFFVTSRKDAKGWTDAILGFFKIVAKGVEALALAWHGMQVIVFKGAEFIVKAIKLQIDTLLLPIRLLAKLPGIGKLAKEMLKVVGKHTADLTTISEGYNEAAAEQIEKLTDIVFGFAKFYTVLDKVKTKLKEVKKEEKALANVTEEDLTPKAREFYGALDQVQSTLDSYIFGTEKVKTANELLMESWGLTSEAQLEFSQLAMNEFMAMEGTIKGFVGAILGTLEKWAIGEIIPKIMAALPFPINLLATGAAIGAIKAIFAGIRSMEEGGTVEREGLHYLHAGEEVKTVEEVRATAGITRAGPGPFHTIVYLSIYAQRLDDRTIDQAAEKIHRAMNRQGRRY